MKPLSSSTTCAILSVSSHSLIAVENEFPRFLPRSTAVALFHAPFIVMSFIFICISCSGSTP